MCRVLGKALVELKLQYGGSVRIFSMYGERNNVNNNNYFPQTVFRGFNNNKVGFVINSFFAGRKVDVVIMSHINLLIPGILIKLIKPNVKLILITHGIEVWRHYPAWKVKILKRIDFFLPVSHFTKNKMMALYGLPEEKFSVLNNCLDPFLERPLQKGKARFLLERYGLNISGRILITVSRLADTEQYKGYDRVLKALPDLLQDFPDLRYILVGKYDPNEKKRLDAIINELGLEHVVVFTGFVLDEEIAQHFSLGDIFIMPSEKEGFGIVFIEAMFYGLPVISGNKDGSVDALCNGELGTIVNPDDPDELTDTIRNILDNPSIFLPNQAKLQAHFSYELYKRKLYKCMKRTLSAENRSLS